MQVFSAPDGTPLILHPKTHRKMDELLLPYVYGQEMVPEFASWVKAAPKDGAYRKPKTYRNPLLTTFDPDAPWAEVLRPSEKSPLCLQCGQFEAYPTPVTPFMPASGSANPLLTVVLDGISRKDDSEGRLGAGSQGTMAAIKRIFSDMASRGELDINRVRWLSLTRCGGNVNLKIKGNWCRYHLVDDLMKHPPKALLVVGSQALAHLSHKSNAGDWSGRILRYRGWPDNWLSDPFYALPRAHPADPKGKRKITGHPLFGPPPTGISIPMIPVPAPYMVMKDQVYEALNRFRDHVRKAVLVARDGWEWPEFNKLWYRFTENLEEAEAGLREILAHPGIKIAYDTETTGLRGWDAEAHIVSMMFRWRDPETEEPRSIGFPFDFPESAMYPHLDRLTRLVWKVLTCSTLVGHNLTFDTLYTFATIWDQGNFSYDDRAENLRRDRRLCALAAPGSYDTWHMAFVYRQQRERLGLEHMAYRFVPDMAGYDEEMGMLIDLLPDSLQPDILPSIDRHYLNCPRDKWDSHLVPYVMGDVETTYRTYEVLEKKLASTDQYSIPLALPGSPNKFRLFTPPKRDFVYEKIMSPAATTLTRMMSRGMYVDQSLESNGKTKVQRVAVDMDSAIFKAQNAFLVQAGQIAGLNKQYVCEQLGLADFMDLDLDSKTHLHKLFFSPECLNLPVYRLTKKGRQLYGETREDWQSKIVTDELTKNPRLDRVELGKKLEARLAEYAAIDKFTLNQLAVKHDAVKPLLEYRKLFKLKTAYLNPLMPIQKKGKVSHLARDGCVHASFLLTGTRGGRLSCRDPNLQQLPRDGAIKELYTSRFGKRGCMYQADLSQIELRLMAAACGDPTMVKAYFDDVDLHSLTASRIFNIPYEHFTKEHMKRLQDNHEDQQAKELDLNRTTAKTVNFLTGYGGGAFGLQNVLAMKGIFREIEYCERIIELFFESYPALLKLLQYYKRFILDNLCAVTIFGRVRFFEEAASEDGEIRSKALRAGCNHLIQSTASDMMLIALFVIEQNMREAGLESLLVSTVHDSLVIDTVREELDTVHDIVYSVLNNFPTVLQAVLGDDYDTSWMLVPFAGDCDVGNDYLHMRKVPKKNVDWDKLLDDKAA